MCGIGLVLEGVRLHHSLAHNEESCCLSSTSGIIMQEENMGFETVYPKIDDLKEVIHRRGPDHMGHEIMKLVIGRSDAEKGLHRTETEAISYSTDRILSGICFIEPIDEPVQSMRDAEQICSMDVENKSCFQERRMGHSNCICKSFQEHKILTAVGGMDTPDEFSASNSQHKVIGNMHFLGATLLIRGVDPVFQPLRDMQSNLLVYNGEIFGGILVGKEESDTQVLMDALQHCCSCPCHARNIHCCCSEKEDHMTVPQLLSRIRGPWSLVYWQEASKILWFGRDAFGRRSLLVHWPSSSDSRFILSSVSPSRRHKEMHPKRDERIEVEEQEHWTTPFEGDHYVGYDYWNELECGIHSIALETKNVFLHESQDSKMMLVGILHKHDWSDQFLKKLLAWERNYIMPENLSDSARVNGFLASGKSKLLSHEILKSSLSDRRIANLMNKNSCNSEMYADSCNSNSENESEDTVIAGDFHSGASDQKSAETKGKMMGIIQNFSMCSAYKVLFALKQAVKRRTCQRISNKILEDKARQTDSADTAVLFSGGLDSMILAALLDKFIDIDGAIDLLNVSFDGPLAPDRVSAKAGVMELRKLAPSRRWRLVEIDVDPSNIQRETNYLTSVIHPAKTFMDLNIGTAIWFSANGDGWIEKEDNFYEHTYLYSDSSKNTTQEKVFIQKQYKSEARVLLVGTGADEQCAGYGRHRTKFRQGGWTALQEELKLDFQRIWLRNLGRDDRCIADNAKEARFPFLDEDVVGTLLDLPLWEIADLGNGPGKGDKKILRQVAQLLGLTGAAEAPKRAIQFGSRIAREFNRKNFGSNRAANQASAGSVVLHCLRE